MNWSDPYILKIHKPANVSSFDIVRKLKRLLPKEVKKIGYFGTLDPFADGLLLVALNQANRLTPYVHEQLSKCYTATGILGIETATQDLTSVITQKDNTDYFQQVIAQFDLNFYQKHWDEFLGQYKQAPPIYSAAKFQGRKLCDWVRTDGIEIKKEEVEKTIFSMLVNQVNFPEITFSVECSSGTYIRTLFLDMAKKMGTLGVLSKLRRTKIGAIANQENLTVEGLIDHWDDYLVDPLELLPYPQIALSASEADDFIHGRPWYVGEISTSTYWASFQSKLLGLAKVGEFSSSKVLVGFNIN